ncbi:MAG: hypothetical protein JXJ17_18540 [Anaerolineae bacterium]|nr:hypothetical protein [Anaerolineae bacterium]
MTERRKIIVLWAVVIASYGLLIVLTNPVVTMPEAEQREVYENLRLQLPPEDEVCYEGSNTKLTAFARTGEAFGLTKREVNVIFNQGQRLDWGPIRWCKER